MIIEKITSTQNKKYKQLLGLHQKKNRIKEQLFIIEGQKEIKYALRAKYDFRSIWTIPDKRGAVGQIAEQADCSCFEISQQMFAKIGYREKTEGILAIAKMRLEERFRLDNIDLYKNQKHLFIICDGVQKPGNIGAIIRIADGVGAAGIIVLDSGFDIYNPNILRNSVGTFFVMPIYVSTHKFCQKWIAKNEVKLVIADPNAEMNYSDIDFQGSCAIVVGNEHSGVSQNWEQENNIKVKIPMNGTNDSLNVSVSTGIIAYEWLRKQQKGFITIITLVMLTIFSSALLYKLEFFIVQSQQNKMLKQYIEQIVEEHNKQQKNVY